MKRQLISVTLSFAFLLALVACVREPQHILVQLVWSDAGATAASVSSVDGGRKLGAIPTGQAGGALTGFYPNPGIDAAALTGDGGPLSMPITCAVGETNCGMAQTNESTATKGADMTFTPQTSSHATDQGGGNLSIPLETPTGTGVEATLGTSRGGTPNFAVGGYPGAGSSYAGLWLGPSFTHDGAHTTIFSDATNPTFNGYNTASLGLRGSNYLTVTFSSGEVSTTAGNNFNIGGATGSYGGCVDCLGMHLASSNPTTVTTGGLLWMGNSGDGLHFTGPAGNGSGPFVDYMMSPTWSGTAANSQQSVVQLKDGGFVRTTNTASAATIYNITMTTGHSVDVQATCVARCVTSSGGCTPGDTMAENFEGAFRDISGTVTHLAEAVPTSPNPIFYAIDTNMLNVVITINVATANTIKIQGTGLANSTIDWTCTDRTVWN